MQVSYNLISRVILLTCKIITHYMDRLERHLLLFVCCYVLIEKNFVQELECTDQGKAAKGKVFLYVGHQA